MKIPNKACKVFRGIIFNVYHWQQEMFDGSEETFEMLERQPTVDILPLVGDKIIVLKQEQPGRSVYPSLVGGRIEKGEEILKTAKRELLEETGYKSERFSVIDEYFGSSKMYYHEHLIVAENCKKTEEQNLDAGEKIEIQLVDFEEFLNLVRDGDFTAPLKLQFEMYEALLDKKKKENLRKKIFENKN